MTAKRIITPYTLCETQTQLDAVVSILQRHGYFSRNQAQATLDLCTPLLPASLTIEQRDAKGSTYIKIKGQTFTMNNRARVST